EAAFQRLPERLHELRVAAGAGEQGQAQGAVGRGNVGAGYAADFLQHRLPISRTDATRASMSSGPVRWLTIAARIAVTPPTRVTEGATRPPSCSRMTISGFSASGAGPR